MSFTEFKDRLKLAMGSESQRSFSVRCKVSTGTLSSYLNGTTTPDLEKLNDIAIASGYSMAWLATGEGSMKRNETISEQTDGAKDNADQYIPVEDLMQLPELNMRMALLPSILDMDDADFCESIGMPEIEFAKVKAGRPVPGWMTRAVAYEHGVRMRWLKMGEEPFRNPSGKPDNFARDMWGIIEVGMQKLRDEGKL